MCLLMASSVTENNWGLRQLIFNGINDTFWRCDYYCKPESVVYFSLFFSMSYKNMMNPKQYFRKADTFKISKHFLLNYNIGHYWKT